MAHPFTEKLEKIDVRLKELTNTINNKSSCFQKEIIDNDEFQKLFNISQGTAANWREQGIISYCQINNKIYYKIEDVKKLIEDHYKSLKKKVIVNSTHISVPIQMFIDAQENNYKKELSVFFLLKLLYRQGKTKLTSEDLLFVEYVNEIKSRKATKRYIKTLIKLRFMSYNQTTGYYLLKSFDRIRADKLWEVRLAFPVDYSNYNDINAVTGAVIYGYLHKDFWRKVKREKSVTICGITFNFPSDHFNYKDKPAPVSVIGVNQIFNISIATASRLKKSAVEAGLIKVRQNYSEPIKDKEMTLMSLKYNEKAQNIVFVKNAYRLRLIDTIYPLFNFTKRTNLKT